MRLVYLLIAFTIGLSNFSNSQSKELISFVNYGQCYSGLKTKQGEIIWPAEFESLQKTYDSYTVSHPRLHYWIAQKNGSFGIIDADGKLIIPLDYRKISIYDDGFIASKENTTYLFSKQGKLTLKLDDFSWIQPTSKGYIVEKEQKTGFLDFKKNEILPPIYDAVHFSIVQQRDEGITHIVSNRFLRIKKDEKYGIFDLLHKKWIVDFTSDYIYADWVTNCRSSDVIFHLSNEKSANMKIVNSSGIEILTHPHYPYTRFQLTSKDSCGTESIQLAYIESDRKMKVLNLKTGQYSNEHQEFSPLQGYSIYFDDKKWGVIDPNFIELERFSYPKYEIDTYEGIENAPRYSTAGMRFNALFQSEFEEQIDSVLITRTEVLSSKRNETEYEKFGLVNFQTGKKVRTNYDEIIRRKLDNQTIFWAVKYSNRKNRYSPKSIDIYTSDLKLVTHIEDIDDIDFDYYNPGHFNVRIERNSLHGIIDAFGKEIVPIVYNKCRVGVFHNIQNPKLSVIYYLCEIDGNLENNTPRKQGIFSSDGSILIPFNYVNIYPQNKLLFATREKDNHDIFTLNGELLFEGAISFINAREVMKNGQCIGKTYSDDKKHVYIAKDNQVHHYFEGKTETYNSQSFDFPKNYCYFLEWVLIDREANIITTEPVGLTRRNRYYSNDYVTDCSTYLDEYPIPTRKYHAPSQPRRTQEPTNKIESVPTYQWKLGTKSDQSKWYLYTPEGKLKYDQPFDYPLPVTRFKGGIFNQNGKFGRFDENYEVDLTAEYDYINYSGKFAKKDDLWFIRKGTSNEWSEGYDAITTMRWNDQRIVFINGKIGLIDDSLNFTIPLTDSTEFVAKYDLVKTLNFKGNYGEQRLHKVKELLFNAQPASVYRKINTIHILEMAFLQSTANEIQAFSPVDKNHKELSSELSNLEFRANDSRTYKERVPTYFNQYFFSEITYTRSQKWYGNYLNGRQYSDKATYNYKIVKNELVPIQLNDILKSDDQSTQKLNEILLRELTEIQAYGNNCTDIEFKIEQLKKNFLIDGYKITFYSGVRNGFQIEIMFNELQDIIQSPKKLKEL